MKCKEVPFVDCFKKILDGLPFEISIFKENTVFIRYKISESSFNQKDRMREQKVFAVNSDSIYAKIKEHQIEEAILNVGIFTL
ncbi:Uncharacterised protein [Chryseobacterium nakagawai]|uniref:Uncharacterized protein n=1 Tax=Chryseobacterium nakagawai TaxID=1241982 RepID=A0AAD0YR24_CHRNA|nr:hypothetical protein [Chryseobacterium nakagawai]AZA93600.1 hypothetical protein EG343_24840 [Chryseobacterium nakagawai]VEH20300.1 Uncharacterised protein [Chryseobacterium nakagawai]